MRGVKCSWKEMQRLHREVLPALARGDMGKYAKELRCIDPTTVTKWQRASEVMSVIDESETEISQFSSFQPSHAEAISRHFRKLEKEFSDDTKEQIIDLVDQCEAEGWTVKQLRDRLKNGSHVNGSSSGHAKPAIADYTLQDALEKLNVAVRAVFARWPKDCIETAGHKLISMGKEILETGGLRE